MLSEDAKELLDILVKDSKCQNYILEDNWIQVSFRVMDLFCESFDTLAMDLVEIFDEISFPIAPSRWPVYVINYRDGTRYGATWALGLSRDGNFAYNDDVSEDEWIPFYFTSKEEAKYFIDLYNINYTDIDPVRLDDTYYKIDFEKENIAYAFVLV